MIRQRLEQSAQGTILILTPELLEQIGVQAGDELELIVVDGALIAQPTAEIERAERVSRAMKALLERRHAVYEALAEGAGQE